MVYRDIREIQDSIENELLSANEKYPHFHSPHEGYAVIKEELEEVWALTKAYKGEWPPPAKWWKKRFKEECVQVAAMAIKFVQSMDE